MKRELLCRSCGNDSIARHHGLVRHFTYDDSPPEYVRHVVGKVRLDRPEHDIIINGAPIPWGPGPCLCDYCSAEMPKGSEAVARTMGRTVAGKDEYDPWESSYLEVAP